MSCMCGLLSRNRRLGVSCCVNHVMLILTDVPFPFSSRLLIIQACRTKQAAVQSVVVVSAYYDLIAQFIIRVV